MKNREDRIKKIRFYVAIIITFALIMIGWLVLLPFNMQWLEP